MTRRREAPRDEYLFEIIFSMGQITEAFSPLTDRVQWLVKWSARLTWRVAQIAYYFTVEPRDEKSLWAPRGDGIKIIIWEDFLK